MPGVAPGNSSASISRLVSRTVDVRLSANRSADQANGFATTSDSGQGPSTASSCMPRKEAEARARKHRRRSPWTAAI